MLNYIRADIYRIFRMKSLYIFMAICLLLFVGINVITNNADVDALSYAFKMTTILDMFPLFIGTFLFGILYNDDLRAKSLQTAIGFGKSRTQIVLVKLIDSIIMLLFTGIIVFTFMIVLPMFLGITLTPEAVHTILFSLIVGIIRTLGYFAIASIATFALQKATSSMLVYVLLSVSTIQFLLNTLLTQKFVINLIGDQSTNLFSALAMQLNNFLTSGNGNILLISLGIVGYIVVSSLVAIQFFKHKELEF